MTISIRLITFAFIFFVASLSGSFALEASFTHAPDKDTGSTDGPLPQSQKQRDQLTQLDQMIAKATNPQETLMKLAEANGMKPEELGELLMRNRRDMEMAQGGSSGGGGGSGVMDSLPRKMIRILATFAMVAFKSASANPRAATLVILVFFSIAYLSISAPRNGVLISRGTTLLSPPGDFLKAYPSNDRFNGLKSSMNGVKSGSLSKIILDEEGHDGVRTIPLSTTQKKTLSHVVSAKKSIPFEALLPSEEELDLMCEKEKESKAFASMDEESIVKLVEGKAWEECVDMAFSSAEDIITARRFSEFIPEPSSRIRFLPRSGLNKDAATMVVKGMGKFGRYGIQPLRVASEVETEDISSVVFYTLKGGHFDGEIKVSVERCIDEDDDTNIAISVSLAIPKSGRKINARLASKIVDSLATSIASSTMTVAKQTLSRRLQSTLYRGKARSRATEKRQIAFNNMKKMEDMARERRRRWQRGNSDAGRYRPSGFRKPEGGPSRAF